MTDEETLIYDRGYDDGYLAALMDALNLSSEELAKEIERLGSLQQARTCP